MKTYRILIIEDEKNIRELLKFNLEREGFETLIAKEGDEGLSKAIKEKPDLIILDLMLPGMSGLEICKTLKHNYKTKNIPIVMATAKVQDPDIVLGLELGADDYVTKPFSLKPFIARIKALLRRSYEKSEDQILKAGKLELDISKHQVTLENKKMELTSKEFKLLKLLIESQGRVLSRETILDSLWGPSGALEVETRVVDKHIGELRRKLRSEASRIITIPNFGYRFEQDRF